jgi:FkbM family methyltransferase
MKSIIKKIRLKILRRRERFEKGSIKIDKTIFKYIDTASFYFMYKEIFEKEIYNFSTKNKEPLIIDCGSNIGISILYFSKKYPNSKIIAFEPDKNIFETLKENIEINNLKNKITLINKAVWKSEESLNFLPDNSDGGKIDNTENTETQKIKAVRLKDFIKDNEVDFLKIDIEGSEFEVIKDCEEILGNVKNIFLEYHSYTSKEQEIDEILLIF